MTLQTLQNEMITAMKNKDRLRKSVLSGLVDAVKKAAIDKNCRDNITETLVDEVLLKYKKTIQEQIDTCPTDRADKFVEYKAQMQIINEYAPKLITDPDEIRDMIQHILSVNGTNALAIQKGVIMKMVMPRLRGKVDMAVANKVLGGMLK